VKPALVAAVLLACLATPAGAKVVCPPGRFVLSSERNAPEPLAAGLPLELGMGRAALPGLCGEVTAGRFLRSGGYWLYRVRARWQRCTRVRPVSLRARFDTNAPYCTRLIGTLRLGGRVFPVRADRVPACGNGLRESGEQCDGVDGAGFGTCCTPDCTLKPGCPLQCDLDRFPCSAPDVCTYMCGFNGVCQPRDRLDCSGGPVCACDTVTTYPDRCAAFAAGTGVAHPGPCQPPASSRRPR
jgi:hypothetical protein